MLSFARYGGDVVFVRDSFFFILTLGKCSGHKHLREFAQEAIPIVRRHFTMLQTLMENPRVPRRMVAFFSSLLDKTWIVSYLECETMVHSVKRRDLDGEAVLACHG